jgi:hypothetical protein
MNRDVVKDLVREWFEDGKISDQDYALFVVELNRRDIQQECYKEDEDETSISSVDFDTDN